ncbi:MAG: hypothetical protein Q7T59_06210 [Candidatus Woesebacteria bacterium]|nr:hypothetical protein [Candidatus Woesebacteria bacterium]
MCDEVTVQRGPRGVAFGGLMTCNSRICPSCGPKIAAGTRTDIERAIAAWMVNPSRRLWFGTFTIRHTKGQPFRELADAVSAAWAAATGGRGWVRDRMEHGIEHTLRIFEQKWSQSNGWHIHVHVLFFIDERFSASQNHAYLLATMFKRWAAKAVALGMGVPLIRAQDLHEVDGAGALERVAGYFAKETTDASDMHPGSIAAEMSNPAGKQGLTSLTPGQILAWAMEGEHYISQLWGGAGKNARGRGISGQEYAKYLYSEFERGMKGRRSIAWSRGMREALGLGAEPTDAELAERQEAQDAATRETLVSMSGPAWQKLNARPGRRAELYQVAQTLDSAQLVDWLAGYGVHAVPHRKDRQGVTFGPDNFGPLPF